MKLVPLWRRLLSLIYDIVLLAALLVLAGFVFLPLSSAAFALSGPWLFRGYLIIVAAIYFIGQWVRGGQTLAMKTWRIKLMTLTGTSLSVQQALLRFGIILFSAGLSFIWAWVDKDHQFLQDRLAGTRLRLLHDYCARQDEVKK